MHFPALRRSFSSTFRPRTDEGEPVVVHRVPCLAILMVVILGGGMPLAPPAVAQRDLTDIPEPDPRAELEAMEVAEGFEVNLFAADPDFAKPIHMNWDAQGRLWIASSRNYPQLKPGAEPTDEVIVLEDTTGDGVADQRAVFADDLMIPTGVLPGDGGVYVANSTELIHLVDSDGDGRADQRTTVLSGFGTEDTHHLLHTLRWRPDGRMAMNQSIYIHSHIDTPYGVERLDGGGIWHFDPRTVDLDVFCRGFVNPWGHAIDPFAQSFVTDGAYFEGINYTFPGAVFATAPGATRILSGLNPGSPKHCGLEFISGDAMPGEMQGVLVTNDFRGHRVCRFRIERSGSGYRSVQLPELIRSQHIAFRPIDVKMGPDGAIYIADWYNPIIQHGEVDFRDPRRDSEHGRIWRITAKGHKSLRQPDYARANPEELAQLTVDSADWVRKFARQELSRRDPSAVDAALQKVVDQTSRSNPETHSIAKLQPLWLQLAQHRLQPETLDTLRDDADPRVRAAAMRVIGEQHHALKAAGTWLIEAASDEDDQVVLEAVCGLDRLGTLEGVQAMLTAAGRPDIDKFLDFALWTGLRNNETVWLPAFESGELEVKDVAALDALAEAATTPVVARLLAQRIADQPSERQTRVAELIAEKGDAESLASLSRWLLADDRSPTEKSELLRMLLRNSRARNVIPARASEWLLETIAGVRADDEEHVEWLSTLAEAAAQWKAFGAAPHLVEWLQMGIEQGQLRLVQASLDALAAMAADGSDSQAAGLGQSVVRFVAGRSEQAEGLSLPADAIDVESRCAALASLSRLDIAAAAEGLVQVFGKQAADDLPPNIEGALRALLSREQGASALQRAVTRTDSEAWSKPTARVMLSVVRGSAQANEALIETIVGATGLEDAGWQMSEELTQRILQMTQQLGDPRIGERIYRREKLECVKCHAIGESGIDIGPNLVSLGGSATPDYILESLLDPAAKVKEGFETLAVLLDTNQIVSGLQKSRTEESIELLLADGTTQTISTDSILAIRGGNSLMPSGLINELSATELAHLMAFLSRLGRTPEYTVDTKKWVRDWETLVWSAEAHRRLNRTSLDTAATDDPNLKWRTISSQVDGAVPVGELDKFQPHQGVPQTAFLRFEIDCQQAGEIRFRFTAPSDAVSFWVDSLPEPTPASEQSVELTAGVHPVVLGIDVGKVDDSFGCELVVPEENAAIFDIR